MTTDTGKPGHVFIGGQDGTGWTYLGTTDGIDWHPAQEIMQDWEPLALPVTASATIPITTANLAVVLRFFHATHAPWRNRRRVSNCRICNPDGNPVPLCIDGREYRRRQLKRRGRRRR